MIEQTKQQIASITRQLKDCTDDDRYAKLWDERVDLNLKLFELENND